MCLYIAVWKGRPGGTVSAPFTISLNSLDFSQEPDHECFPALRLCRQALERGGGVPAALSAADEEVVDAFLKDRIGFTDITDILAEVLSRVSDSPVRNLGDVLEAGRQGADLARKLLEEKS